MIAGIPESVRSKLYITEGERAKGGPLHLSNGRNYAICDASHCHLCPHLSAPFQAGTLAWGTDGIDWCKKCETKLLELCKEATNVSALTETRREGADVSAAINNANGD